MATSELLHRTSAPGSHPANQLVIRFVLPFFGCLFALGAGWFVVSYPNPFTTAVVLCAAVMFVTAICNPIAGVYLLVFSSGYLDLIKRLGILTNALSQFDIFITLAVAPLLVMFIGLGMLIRSILNRSSPAFWQVILALVIAALMGLAFFQSVIRGGGSGGALKEFANSGAYFPLILAVPVLFPRTVDLQKLLTFCFWVYLPVAIYGIWQQFFGLTSFEIDYLKSGFTIEVGLLDDVKIRPFSTLNSPHSLGVCMAVLAALALFVPLRRAKRRPWQLWFAAIFALACLATVVRGGWVLFLIAVLVWLCCRRPRSTWLMYGGAVFTFAVLVFNADTLLRSIDTLQTYLPQDGDLESQAFRLGTFSERLMSYNNVLTNPEFHTVFGHSSDEADAISRVHADVAHDAVGQVLLKSGWAGLLFFVVTGGVGLLLAHRAVFRQSDGNRRRIMTGILSVLIAIVLSGMLFGSHLGVFPVNLFFSLLAGAFCGAAITPATAEETPAAA